MSAYAHLQWTLSSPKVIHDLELQTQITLSKFCHLALRPHAFQTVVMPIYSNLSSRLGVSNKIGKPVDKIIARHIVIKQEMPTLNHMPIVIKQTNDVVKVPGELSRLT